MIKKEEWDEFLEITSIIPKVRPFVVDYLAMADDYNKMIGIEEEIKRSILSSKSAVVITSMNWTINYAKAQKRSAR